MRFVVRRRWRRTPRRARRKTPAARKPRTRKTAAKSVKDAPAPEAAASEAAPAETPAPRKRGRRTKAEIEAAKAAEAAAAAAAQPAEPAAPAADQDVPAEKPKARKPRAKKAAAETAADSAEKATPKKPGRKRAAKTAEPKASETPAAFADKTPERTEDKPARVANAGALARHRRAEKQSAASQEAKSASKAEASVKSQTPAEPQPVVKPQAPAEPRVLKYGEEATGPIIRRRPGRSPMFSEAPKQAQEAVAQPAEKKAEQPSGQGEREDGFKREKHSKYDKRDRRARFDKENKDSASEQDESESRYGRKRRDRDRRSKQNDNRQNDQGQGRKDRDDRRDRNDRDRRDRDDRRQRRERNNQPLAPKTNKEELAALKVAELRAKAAELELDVTGLKKAELVEKVYEAAVRAEGFIEVEGILDTMPDGYGFLRTKGYLPSEGDIYVGTSVIRRNNLRKGDMVKGQTRPSRENEKFAALQTVMTVNGTPVAELGHRVKFGDLTPVFPDECLTMEHGKSTITARVIDLVSPIGKGQRGLIVSPPKAGKTTVLKDIAAAITANNPEVHLMCLLVDERPEEVTDMQRSIKGEVIASTFDMPTENHITVSELVIERAKRLVERGEDVVVLLDSLTRLARAYNLAQPASGRILSGGVDSTALYPPKKFLGAARNIEGGGSLTILASALVETGSKMDEVIFEEFKGTGSMELKLDRYLADRRIFPAIDPITSGTRKEDLLLNPQEAPLIWAVRRILANMNSTERAMDMLIKSLKQTKDNQEFLLRTAKKAQNQTGSTRDDEFGATL